MVTNSRIDEAVDAPHVAWMRLNAAWHAGVSRAFLNSAAREMDALGEIGNTMLGERGLDCVLLDVALGEGLRRVRHDSSGLSGVAGPSEQLRLATLTSSLPSSSAADAVMRFSSFGNG